MTKYLQSRIAQSRWTLPVTAIYAALVCISAGLITQQLWGQVLLLAISTLLMVELNNSNSLIRIYSRTVSCSFLVMSVMSTFLLRSVESGFIALTLIAFYLYFFKAYQDQSASGIIFAAFFAIGLMSISFIQILFFIPVFWVLMATNILAFSIRTFFASIIGFIAPYWFVAAYYIYIGDFSFLLNHLIELTKFEPILQIGILDEHRLITAAFIIFLAIIGSLHFLLYSYKDKIRIRMIYETFITLDACCIIFIILQPQYFDKLLPMVIATTAPLIGHYLALSHTKISNIFFFVTIAISLLLTAYNLWMPSMIF